MFYNKINISSVWEAYIKYFYYLQPVLIFFCHWNLLCSSPKLNALFVYVKQWRISSTALINREIPNMVRGVPSVED